MTTELTKMIEDRAKELLQIAHPTHDFKRYPCDTPEQYIRIAKHCIEQEIRARIDATKRWGNTYPFPLVVVNHVVNNVKILESQLSQLKEDGK